MQSSCLLSIILINYNGIEDTCELLDTIPSEMEGLEVVVVDNASSRNEADQIAQRYPWAVVVKSQRNLGFAGGNNLGIQNANGQFLLFINNDTLLAYPDEQVSAAERLLMLMDFLRQHPQVGIVCPMLRHTGKGHPVQWVGYTPLTPLTLRNSSVIPDNSNTSQPHVTPYAHGAAMLTTRDIIRRVGLMPEEYFLYYEELDWSLSFRKAGYGIWVEPRCTVYHKESSTTGKGSAMQAYYLTRNRLIFAQRNLRGVKRMASIAYQMCIAAPCHWLVYAMKGQQAWRSSIERAVCDFVRGRKGKDQMQQA
jgi:hypothetical protein